MQPVPVSPSTVAEAGSSIIKDTALGAFSIICLALAVWAIWQLKKVQDARTDDKEKSIDRLLAASAAERTTYDVIRTAVTELKTSVEGLKGAVERNTVSLNENTKGVNDVIRDALRPVYRRPSGGQPAVRDPAPTGYRGDPRRE